MAFIAPDNLPEILTRDISEKIIRNELKPGERILETKIAAEMGVSRSPVRESLRMLEKNRLVELIPRKGARVTDLSVEAVLEAFRDQAADAIIAGHVHRERNLVGEVEGRRCRFLGLGAWGDRGSFAELRGGQLQLHRFAGEPAGCPHHP